MNLFGFQTLIFKRVNLDRYNPARGVSDEPRDRKGNVPAGSVMHDYVPITSGSEAASRKAFLITPQASW